MTVLSQQDQCDFSFLKTTLQTTDGNLSTHVTKLETAGYLSITKTFRKKIPHTSYRLTALGKTELSKYLVQMRDILQHSEM